MKRNSNSPIGGSMPQQSRIVPSVFAMGGKGGSSNNNSAVSVNSSIQRSGNPSPNLIAQGPQAVVAGQSSLLTVQNGALDHTDSLLPNELNEPNNSLDVTAFEDNSQALLSHGDGHALHMGMQNINMSASNGSDVFDADPTTDISWFEDHLSPTTARTDTDRPVTALSNTTMNSNSDTVSASSVIGKDEGWLLYMSWGMFV